MVKEQDGSIVLLVPNGSAHRLVHRLHAQVLVVDLKLQFKEHIL